MVRCLWGDVVEREGQLGLEHLGARDLAAQDLGKYVLVVVGISHWFLWVVIRRPSYRNLAAGGRRKMTLAGKRDAQQMTAYPSGMDLAQGDLSGVWASRDGALIYREVPKAACSALAQLIYHADHGAFFDGDVHDATSGVTRWPFDPKLIVAESLIFSAVRNPYARIVSGFRDKICTLQRDGKPYRNTLRQVLHERYGVDLAGDPVRAFRRFLLFVRDVTLNRERFWYDRHWTAQAQHLRALPLNGLSYGHLFQIEAMETGLSPVLARVPAATRPAALPRFNANSNTGRPLSDWFDDLSIHLMQELYRWDFELFCYDRFNPAQTAPIATLDVDAINMRLSNPHAPHWARLEL